MNFDFTAVLAIATLVCGAIWGGHALYRRLKQRPAGISETGAEEAAQAEGEEEYKTFAERLPRYTVDIARFLFPVLLIVTVVRGFIVEPFKIPSGSMLPTLDVGDYILVNKFSYGLRSPIGYYKLIDLGAPKRGDVIVFRYPENPSVDYIKRVIGVPGDKIVYRDKQLWINDQKIKLKDLHVYADDPHYEELQELLGKVTHHILLNKEINYMAQPQEYKVPPGEYFAMGDNRDNSRDSRVWGFVPDANLKGRAFLIWWSSWNYDIKWSRIGMLIK